MSNVCIQQVGKGQEEMGGKKKAAVIGGGVSGLAAAWHLAVNANDEFDVELFEAEPRLGGHAETITIDGGDIDVAFVVFNDENYPNLVKWFEQLGQEHEPSDMSYSVSLDDGKTVEWGSDGLSGLLAKPTQIFNPKFQSFVKDMLRFNAECPKLLSLDKKDPRRGVTMGQYLRDNNYSEGFCSYYLVPMVAAIWSSSVQQVMEYPAESLIAFFCNHKLIAVSDRRQWKTPKGRSKTYTLKMKEILGQRAHVSTPIVSAKKLGDGKYEIFTEGEKSLGTFDELIFACHAPTSAKILSSALGETSKVVDLLSKIEYGDSVRYVHSDPKLMPKRKAAWCSWNSLGDSSLLSNTSLTANKKAEAMEGCDSGFGNTLDGRTDKNLEGKEGRMKAVYITYWMNRLENLKTDKDYFVSLNPHVKPDPALTHQRKIVAHPQFNNTTMKAREELKDKYQGKEGLWFCGAWAGHGFHEDGCRSGFDVATQLTQKAVPWCDQSVMVAPGPDLTKLDPPGPLTKLYQKLTYDLPVWICKYLVFTFMRQSIQNGKLSFKFNDGSVVSVGDGSPTTFDKHPVTVRVFDPWMFVKIALEYDLGLARSYMAGHFVVEPLADPKMYDPAIRSIGQREETTLAIGDPVGLTRFFLLFIANRDSSGVHVPKRAGMGHRYNNAIAHASGLVISKIGSLINTLRFRLFMDNSERGGSLKNIHAHYDLSNDLFRTFLDKETLIYSSAIYDAVKAPAGRPGVVFRGSLEQAQWRKLDTLLARAQLQPGQTVLDIGFGWGGLSIHAAKKYGCKVTGITLSVEQKALAEERVRKEGLEHLIHFEVCDYRVFGRRKENLGKFDRVLSCEMIEAVGHEYLPDFFWAVEQVLKRDGILVMEAITTPEERYEVYRRSTDFINTIIFPGGLAPSLHALVDAAYKASTLTLEHIDNIGLHYAKTLMEWRMRFNEQEPAVRKLGFDDIFLRVWNYYMTYCEAGFVTQTLGCLILVFSRPSCAALTPLSEARSVTQATPLTDAEIENWMKDGN